MFVSRAKTFWIAAATFGLAISLPLAWVYWQTHQSSQSRTTAATTTGTIAGTTTYILQPEDWAAPLVLVTGVLALFTGLLWIFTARLWNATHTMMANEQKRNRDIRSIIRGAGTTYRPPGKPDAKPNRFLIEASNSGEGPALIERVHWRFVERTDFETEIETNSKQPSYPNTEDSGEVVPRRMRSQPTKFVAIPDDKTDPVIVFRLDYYDINRKRSAIIEHAMRIVPPDVPELPAFFNVPPKFLADDFPVERV
jgi:hypothetical protein